MRNLPHRQYRAHTLLAIWISLALILTPMAAQAAPAASLPAQTTPYEDPAGRFSLDVPDGFTEETEVTYDMLGDNPLDKLLASSGIAFTDPEAPNNVTVLFLLLDEPIRDRDAFAGFLAAFQTAAGGQVLPLVDLEFVDGDTLRAAGQAATRTRALQIEIEAKDNLAAVITANVERTQYRKLRGALDDALDSFTWNPDVVIASLGGDTPPTPEEPAVEEPAVGEPAEDEPQPAPGISLETERYSDSSDVFSISLPAGLTLEDFSDDDEAIYGLGYFDPEDDAFPAVAVAFTPAAFAAQGAFGEVEFREIEDEEWDDFVDVFLLEDASDMVVYEDVRDEVLRTAFVILEAEEGDENNPPEMWVWLEESDGIGAVFAVVGELDDPENAEIFHTALTSFTWSPQRAASAIAAMADLPDPADAPVDFADPLGLIDAATTPAYPFQSAYFEEDSLEYSFGRNAIDGLFRISLSVPSDGAFNADGWGLIVDATEQNVMETLSDGTLGGNARLVSSEIDVLDVGADNTAVLLARTDAYWMAVALLDVDGVLVSEVIIVPDSYWQEHEDAVVASVEQGVYFDPDAIREAIDATEGLGAAVLDTAMTKEVPAAGEEIESRYFFDPDEDFTVAVDFVESGLTGNLKAIIYADDLPDYPLAQYALWLGDDELYTFGKMTSQEETGTRAAFTYRPDYPTTPGAYTVVLYYDNEPVASHGFTVEDAPASEAELANLGAYYGDAFNNEPILITKAIHPGDIVNVRGTGDLPPDSQLRLFWYDPDGWLVADEVLTIRLDSSFHSLYDWIYFDTVIDWQPGYYSYLLTLNGEPFADGELLVVEESAAVELTPDGGEIFANLPLLADLEIAPVVEGIDLAVAPSEEYPDVDIISAVDAWLRMQGWQPTLPPTGSPVAWEYRRWVKDGYQFLLQPGPDGSEAEIWMRYAPLNDVAFGALPAGDALDVENLDVLDEVAEVEIAGLDVAEAAMSPDGNWLAATTTDGTLYFFDAHRLMDAMWWQPAEAFYANPVFSPDSRYLAVTVQRQNRSQVQIYHNFDVVWLPTTLLDGHTGEVTAIDYQSDGWLISGGLDGGLRQWESTADFLPVMVDTDGPVTGVSAAPEEASGVLAGLEGGRVEYRLDDGDVPWSDLGAITELPRIAVWSQFDEDGVGDLVVYGEGQAEWYAYDTEDAQLVGDLPEDNPDFASTGAAFSPNGSLLVIGGPYVSFFNRFSGAPLGDWDVTIEGEPVTINSLRISPDGMYVIAVTDDGLLRLWAAAAQ